MPTTKTAIRAHSEEPSIPRASRASWTGQLQFKDIAIPVKAYALTVTSPSGPLCQIHANCGQKIEYRKCCPVHGHIPNDAIGRAFPYAENDLVALTDQELEPLAPNPEHLVQLKQFFDPALLNLPSLSGRSFQLVPSHAAALVPYIAFAEALQHADLCGFGTIGLSGRIQLLVARACEQRIQLFLLHWPAQCRMAPELDATDAANIAPLSKQFLRQIQGQVGPISWRESRDDWDSRLAGIVQAKVAARTVSTLSLRSGARSKPAVMRTPAKRSRKPARAA